MTKKQVEPDINDLAKPQDYDSVPAPDSKPAIARQFPSLLQSGVLLPSGEFREGHLEHILRYYNASPTEAWRLFADDMAYIVATMPEVLQ